MRTDPARCTRAARLAAGALMLLGDAALLAQTAPPQAGPTAAASTAEPEEGADIVVTGFRQSYADSLSAKRASERIIDTVTADGLGRFPDLNIGEAIQRLPGVQINREADSRNATISLRGLPGTFARTTLNGAGFADPILSNATSTGSTPLGAFNADIFTAVTVIKSPDAATLAGGLSGNVDLEIAPALGRKPGGFAKIGYEYNELGELGSPALAAGYNARVGERLALFGVLSYKEERFRRDSISVNSWSTRLGAIQVGNQRAAGSNPVFDVLAARFPGGVYFPNQVRQFVRSTKGHLLTGAGGAEWEAADGLRIGVTGFYTKRDLSDATNQLLYIDTIAGNGNNTGLIATSGVTRFTALGDPIVVDTPDGPRAYINRFSAENIQTFDSIRAEPAQQRTWAITPAIAFERDRLQLRLQGTVSRARTVADQFEVDLVQLPYRNLGPAGLNGNTVSIYTGGTDLSRFVADLVTPNAAHVPGGGYTLLPSATAPTQAGAPMPGQPAGVAGARLGITGSNARADNHLEALQADAERAVALGPLTALRAGVRYERNSYRSSGSRNTALGAQVQAFGQDQSLPSPYAGDFFNGQAAGYTQAWRSVDTARVLAAITPVNTAPRSAANPNGLPGQFVFDPATGVFLTPFGLINNYADPSYWNANFINRTNVLSLYGMARGEAAIGGVTIRGNAGLRYERTRQTINALDCLNCVSTLAGVAAPPVNHAIVGRSYRNDYDYLLPSAMLAADLTRTLKLRGAYYRTYVRPQPRDNVPVTFVQQPEPLTPPVDPAYIVQIGATRLRPYTADSFDLALEWYNRPGGVFAVNLFQKNVRGYIGPITDPGVLCPADGRINGIDLGLGSLTVDGPNCVSSNRFPGAAGTLVNARVLASGITNQLPIRVRGAELAVQQNFDFLPGPLRYLGGAANYTYVDVDGSDAAGNPLTLPSVARHTVNLVGYYEREAFGVRLTYNHRGAYDLAAGNSFVGDARTVKARGQLDASASLNLFARFTLRLDAFNLTDARRAEYENDPRLPRRLDYDGRTYRLTLQARF